MLEHGHSFEYALNMGPYERMVVQSMVLADIEMNPLKYKGL